MKLEEALERLRVHRDEWDDGSLSDLAVFGSVARGEARDESDVDFLLTFSRPTGLMTLVRFKLLFEDLLGRRVDVVTPSGLKLPLRSDVLEDAVSLVKDPPSERPRARRKRWRWRIDEMLGAISKIERYTKDLDFARFRDTDLVRDAVLHNLLVLGENVTYLPDEVKLVHADVPWEELRQMRHLVAHDYFGLDMLLLWFTIRHDLPEVKEQLERVAKRD
ncbi:HepT-like ribonuclease domain-containing protein [Deinococcus yavapaiensis]|uniref:Polymerase nucleotidyl transferase domain-containing protein n=1 Tax=Deinococcus yavapaiensis KR-236 TaxID=694435 RepID=A0A318SRR4_9DEIO|nr:HepT-like ribonuclease domain-containing protein [Deinococcus yavapaiensis]PYE55777.1 hypothetical protein DES52_102141 [Deinococcus yavapaiensis KR-236]